jgi:hypothetical protein
VDSYAVTYAPSKVSSAVRATRTLSAEADNPATIRIDVGWSAPDHTKSTWGDCAEAGREEMQTRATRSAPRGKKPFDDMK